MIGTILSLWLAASVPSAPTPKSVTLPFEVEHTYAVVRAKVGTRTRRMVLSTLYPITVIPEQVELGQQTEVSIGECSLGKTQLWGDDQSGNVPAEGSIGLDLLKGTAVGFDPWRCEVTLWPKGKLNPKEAAAWVMASTGPGMPGTVRRLPTGHTKELAPTLETSVGGTKTPMSIQLAYNGAMLQPGPKVPTIPIDERRRLLPPVAIAGMPPLWFDYNAMPEGFFGSRWGGVPGAIDLASFGGRRMLVDFAGGAVYVEELSADARLARFLERYTSIPMTISGDTITVDVQDEVGKARLPALVPYYGLTARRIGNEPVEEWLRNLRRTDEAAARWLAPRLAKIIGPSQIDVLTPDGREVPLRIHVRPT